MNKCPKCGLPMITKFPIDRCVKCPISYGVYKALGKGFERITPVSEIYKPCLT